VNAIIARIKAEPAVFIGAVATAVVFVVQQVVTSGIVQTNGALNLLNTVVSITPLVAGWLIRNFVTPVDK
jgi:hypothetical protein